MQKIRPIALAVLASWSAGCASWSINEACHQLDVAADAYAVHRRLEADGCGEPTRTSARQRTARQSADRNPGAAAAHPSTLDKNLQDATKVLVDFLENGRTVRQSGKASSCIQGQAYDTPEAAIVMSTAVNARVGDRTPLVHGIVDILSVGIVANPHLSRSQSFELQEGIFRSAVAATLASEPSATPSWESTGLLVRTILDRWYGLIESSGPAWCRKIHDKVIQQSARPYSPRVRRWRRRLAACEAEAKRALDRSLSDALGVSIDLAAAEWVPAQERVELFRLAFDHAVKKRVPKLTVHPTRVAHLLRLHAQAQLDTVEDVTSALELADWLRELGAEKLDRQPVLPAEARQASQTMVLRAYDRAAELATNQEELSRARTGLIKTLLERGSPVLALDLARQNLATGLNDDAVIAAVRAEREVLRTRDIGSELAPGLVCLGLVDSGHVQYAVQCAGAVSEYDPDAGTRVLQAVLRSGNPVPREVLDKTEDVEAIAKGLAAAQECYSSAMLRPSWGSFNGPTTIKLTHSGEASRSWELNGDRGSDLASLVTALADHEFIETDGATPDAEVATITFSTGARAPKLELDGIRLRVEDWALEYAGLALGAAEPATSVCLTALAANECLTSAALGGECSATESIRDYLDLEPDEDLRRRFLSMSREILFDRTGTRIVVRDDLAATFLLDQALADHGLAGAAASSCGIAQRLACLNALESSRTETSRLPRSCRQCYAADSPQ